MPSQQLSITFTSQIKAFGHGGSPLPWVKQPSPLRARQRALWGVCSSALGIQIHGARPHMLQLELHVHAVRPDGDAPASACSSLRDLSETTCTSTAPLFLVHERCAGPHHSYQGLYPPCLPPI